MACRGLPRDPVGLGEDDPNSVGGARPSPLVGTWQVILLIDAGADLQRWTTRWTFQPSGQCHLNRKIDSQLEGTSRTSDRDCTYIDRGSLVEVTYLDTRSTVAMPYSVPLNSTTRLVIEGVEYERAP